MDNNLINRKLIKDIVIEVLEEFELKKHEESELESEYKSFECFIERSYLGKSYLNDILKSYGYKSLRDISANDRLDFLNKHLSY
jgi:hypothetical protein